MSMVIKNGWAEVYNSNTDKKIDFDKCKFK